MKIELQAAQVLISRKKTLSTAESCTGGLLSKRLTDIPGSSKFFKYGVICYSNESKAGILHVPEALLKKYGAVSSPVALRITQNVRKISNTDYAIGISGIAGPDGGTKAKPVGMVFVSIASRHDSICLECNFSGNRKQIRSKAAVKALKLLLEFLP